MARTAPATRRRLSAPYPPSFDGVPWPRDYIEGPGTEELDARIMAIKRALQCP